MSTNNQATPQSKNIEIIIRFTDEDGTRKEQTFNTDVMLMTTLKIQNDKLANGQHIVLGNARPSHLIKMLEVAKHKTLQVISKEGKQHDR